MAKKTSPAPAKLTKLVGPAGAFDIPEHLVGEKLSRGWVTWEEYEKAFEARQKAAAKPAPSTGESS